MTPEERRKNQNIKTAISSVLFMAAVVAIIVYFAFAIQHTVNEVSTFTCAQDWIKCPSEDGK